jgi:uncharacterized Ntn-hydrolase superfamily protein
MTFSIVARDEKTGRVGIAAAAKLLAIGARIAAIRTGVGAIANQAVFNPYYGPRGLALLAAGASAADVVRLLTTADEGRDVRQVLVLDRSGRVAAYTGGKCPAWSGQLLGANYAVAGSFVASAKVIEAVAGAYEVAADMPFARRLILAMIAGERAGGDTCGRQSGCLLVHDDQEYSQLDLRSDDHPNPLAELERMEEIARKSWLHYRRILPSRADAHGVLDDQEADARVAASIAEGYH